MAALLHPRLVREHVANLPLPADVDARREIIRGWIKALRRGELASANEIQLHGEFLTNLFGRVLGYRMLTTAADDGTYELIPEKELTGRKSSDGALGFFGGTSKHVVAPIELKGADQ